MTAPIKRNNFLLFHENEDTTEDGYEGQTATLNMTRKAVWAGFCCLSSRCQMFTALQLRLIDGGALKHSLLTSVQSVTFNLYFDKVFCPRLFKSTT